MINGADVLGYIASATNVAGNIMLTGKSVTGWWIRLVSIMFWGAHGIVLMNWPIMINAVIFFGINCVGIYRWRKQNGAAT